MTRPSSEAEALDLIATIVVRALKRAEDAARQPAGDEAELTVRQAS